MPIQIAISCPSLSWRKICFGQNPKRTLARVLVWTVLTTFFFHHLLLPIKIVGFSMCPTYPDGSVNFINTMAYARSMPKRGDVIALRKDNEILLKRIVGLPGEQVAITAGTIQINGRPLEDRFMMAKVLSETPPVALHQEEYFIIGDNRQISIYGKTKREEIVGKIVF